ncbi:MAG: hypothetical protein IKX10_10050 [Lachnospiraceae bacterium]|nr:hypothetical protein [Lachnospiraceae bacterium]
MTFKKAYIIDKVFEVLTLLLLGHVLILDILLKSVSFGKGYMLFVAIFSVVLMFGQIFITHHFFKACPYCGKELTYKSNSRGGSKACNPWKGCPHCGHELD